MMTFCNQMYKNTRTNDKQSRPKSTPSKSTSGSNNINNNSSSSSSTQHRHSNSNSLHSRHESGDSSATADTDGGAARDSNQSYDSNKKKHNAFLTKLNRTMSRHEV
mmetsp:Transcript_41541/g.66791  ORF Transcript_41541/g.66791 Transcript_41541/m.66791 type:complete len:106 (+) Transcript_41541:728-1045(+)